MNVQAPVMLADTPMEPEEAVYPCKGCGEILEEGKAFELAGNRWHIDCFRCNTCGTLLDSDANLLLLGDGSLICNNCTYSCSACGNKIEDLAILTGDQAFCASCFKCRNCKRKIDNLRYARTSQGIFCMQCHESLMARRRKRSKGMPRTVSTTSNGTSGLVGSGPVALDKNLPALPPHAAPSSLFPLDSDPIPAPTSDVQKDHLVLPSTTYVDGHSVLSSQLDTVTPAAEDDFFIPVALDPAATNGVPPLSIGRKANEQATSRDYFGASSKHASAPGAKDDFQDLVAGSSRSASMERSQSRQRRSPLAAPHIASQAKGRKTSADLVDGLRKPRDAGNDHATSSGTSPTVAGFDKSRLSPSYEPADPGDREGFRLQEAPRSRPNPSRENSKQSFRTAVSPLNEGPPQLAITKDAADSSVGASSGYFEAFDSSEALQLSKRKGSLRRSRSPVPSPASGGVVNTFDRPTRDDSLFKHGSVKQIVSRKEVPRSELEPPTDAPPAIPERRLSASSLLARQDSKNLLEKSNPRQFAPTIATTFVDGPPARSPRRPHSTRPEEDRDFPTPRGGVPLAPPPSANHRHRQAASVSSIQSEGFSSHDSLRAPSVDDELGRGSHTDGGESGGLFRRVSMAVKHGRSHSDKITAAPSPKWKRNGSADMTSPLLLPPDSKEEIIELRNKLRFANQKVTELESEKIELQEKINGTVELRQINVELREKRTTMTFLETQREMVIRELEVMTDHLSKAKDSKAPLDMDDYQAVVIRDFATALQKLKDSLETQIDELMRKKNDTTNQMSSLMQLKERIVSEYEALNAKNAQLVELNNQLVQNIQEYHRQSRQPGAPPPPYANAGLATNGLGIYTNNDKDASGDSKNALITTDGSVSHLSGDNDLEPATVLSGPKVVDIRKGQQQKKFNWKKGSQTVAKNVSKGFKGAFGGSQNSALREEQFAEGLPYGAMQPGELPISGNAPFAPSKMTAEQAKQWGFLAPQKSTSGKGAAKDSATSLAALDSSNVFGSELSARCEYEKRLIPSIVSRCIEQVELRGIALEGIYRKSGSASQVKSIQQGFEKDHLQYDISDPDLDIHAVTSALKQYFRKLPNPLITFEAYDPLLDAILSVAGEEVSGKEVDEERAWKMREVLIEALPTSHRETLEFLIEHLARVMERESENLMTPLNLAVVFAPTIMRPQSIEREMVDMQVQRQAVQLMLEYSRIVFDDGDED